MNTPTNVRIDLRYGTVAVVAHDPGWAAYAEGHRASVLAVLQTLAAQVQAGMVLPQTRSLTTRVSTRPGPAGVPRRDRPVLRNRIDRHCLRHRPERHRQVRAQPPPAGRGESAFSLDAVDGLCRWQDHAGEPVSRPEHPDLAWLGAHEWCWHGPILDRLVASERHNGRPRSFLCGIATNQRQFLHRFGLVVMLDVPIGVMLARLDNTSRGNDFGRAGASKQLLADRFHTDRARLQATADHIIDATAAIEDVADILCAPSATSSPEGAAVKPTAPISEGNPET